MRNAATVQQTLCRSGNDNPHHHITKELRAARMKEGDFGITKNVLVVTK
jgi:hypothetical protein